MIHPVYVRFFFFNDTATTEIYTLSLHDALPIYRVHDVVARDRPGAERAAHAPGIEPRDEPPEDGETLPLAGRSEEHTSELQSQSNLVCRLLLEKNKTIESSHSHNVDSFTNTQSL